MSGREGSLFASLAQRVEGPGSQTQNLQVSGFGLSVWLAMLSVPWALAEECFLPGSGMIGEGGAGGTAVGALFPKYHSHDSDLRVLPLSLVFFSSTAFGPASVSLLYFPFLNLHKALRGLELPWGLLPLVRLVSGSWTADLGLSALEGPGKASGGLVGSRQANEPAPQGWPCTRHPAAGAGGGGEPQYLMAPLVQATAPPHPSMTDRPCSTDRPYSSHSPSHWPQVLLSEEGGTQMWHSGLELHL